MTWVKLDDQFADNPKLERAGPLAAWLSVAALCYSARHLTDGLVPQAKAARLADVPSPAKHVKALLREGVWHEPGHTCESAFCGPVPDGHYLIHDYLDYQRSRTDVEAEREKEREKKRQQRERAAAHRNGDGTFAGSPNGTHDGNPEGGPRGTTSGTPRGNHQGSPSVPVPSRPSVVTFSDPSRRLTGHDDELSTGNGSDPADDGFPLAVWALYADVKLARQRPGSVDNTIAWKLTTADNARIEHGDTATRWWSEYDVTAEHLAQCLVDGKAPAGSHRRKTPWEPSSPWPTEATA